MPEPAADKVWVVVRVPKGSRSPDEVSIHKGFYDRRAAELICDILNRQNENPQDEFRVLEMPRFRTKTGPPEGP